MQKKKDLLAICLIYLAAFAVGTFAGSMFSPVMMQLLAFDLTATIVVFVFSVLYHIVRRHLD